MDDRTDFIPETVHPQSIEERSFAIIDEEMGEHSFTIEQYPIVRRVIHASADFELGRSILFHPAAVQAGIAALSAGKKIVADVQMIEAGVNKERLGRLGTKVHVYISDPDVVAVAKREGSTRAIMAMRKAAERTEGAIFVIGNAPTALLELIRLIKEGRANPSLIIGLPVGFVSASESKQELAKLDIPYITNHGRKGGSTISVAALNALLIMATQTKGLKQ